MVIVSWGETSFQNTLIQIKAKALAEGSVSGSQYQKN